MIYFFQQTILYTVPLLIVALAGVFAERSGVLNIALEGIMIFGAFIGVLTVRLFLNFGFDPDKGQLLLIISCLTSSVLGGLFSLLLAFTAINLKANQTVSGTALNLLAPAIVLFLIMIMTNQNSLDINSKYNSAELFMLFKEDFGFKTNSVIINVLFNKIYLTTYYAIVLFVILSILLYKTKFGLRLRACGENPYAINSLGISVSKLRYIGTFISGALAGFGGFLYALNSAGCSATGSVSGLGFLALAVMIFGNWKPLNIFLCALLFGALKCISVGYPYIDFNNDGIYLLKELGISSHIYRLLPYVITLLVLILSSHKNRGPKSVGIPFEKERR